VIGRQDAGVEVPSRLGRAFTQKTRSGGQPFEFVGEKLKKKQVPRVGSGRQFCLMGDVGLAGRGGDGVGSAVE